MGQYFDLINFDKRQRACGGGKLGEFLFDEGLPLALKHFTIPTWSEDDIITILKSLPSSVKSTTKLLKLPVELVTEIFKQMDELRDVVSLCVIDVFLFRVGLPRLQTLHRAVHASWAGDRVLCLGGSCTDQGYPASVQQLVNDEIKELNTSSHGDYAFHQVRYGAFRCERYLLDPIAVRRAPEAVRIECATFNYLSEARYVSNHPWVLCNLSKGEYVRAQAIRDFKGDTASEKEDGPFISGHINLGVALLVRICWSTSCSTNMAGQENRLLHQGPWAGDRFEVTTMDRMLPGLDWQDVSEEVFEEILELWKTDYGEDWRKYS